MRVRFGCEACDATVEAPLREEAATVRCLRCTAQREAASSSLVAPEGSPVRCAVCPGDDLYLQRDFPRRLGLALMGLGGAGFLVLAGTGHPLAGFCVLGGIALLDTILFRALPVVTVCYRCGAELRGASPSASHTGFDHHLAELAAKRAAVDRANRTPSSFPRQSRAGS